jgi:hypothetical protein
VSIKKISSSIASPFCYPIKLQIFLLLPLSIYPKRGLGALKKKERKKERRKEEDKCPNIREVLSSPSSLQILQSQERYKFLQGAKVELGVHHIHSTHISRTTHMHILI